MMQVEGKKTKDMMLGLMISVILVVFDQWTKLLALAGLKNQAPKVLWDGVFELHYLENQSAAFGVDPVSILQRIFNFAYFAENPQAFLLCKMIFFTVLTVLAILVMIYFYQRVPVSKRYLWMNVILVLFVSGAIGNLIDRVMRRYVVDFFYFKLINFPIFNVADIYVTVAAFLFIAVGLFYYKEEDFEIIFSLKKKKEEKE